MGIIRNILYRSGDILRIFYLDQVVRRQQQQAAAAVGGIVGDANLGAVGNLVAGFQFFGINVDGEQRGIESLRQFEFRFFLHGGFQERLMLIAVGPDFAGSQRRIGGHEIAELFNFDFQALLFRNLLYVFHDDGMGPRIYAYDDRLGCIRLRVLRFFISAATAGQCQGQNAQSACKY